MQSGTLDINSNPLVRHLISTHNLFDKRLSVSNPISIARDESASVATIDRQEKRNAVDEPTARHYEMRLKDLNRKTLYELPSQRSRWPFLFWRQFSGVR